MLGGISAAPTFLCNLTDTVAVIGMDKVQDIRAIEFVL